ncbi:restriction endonuclease subunit S, partial [Halovenus sp. HT40]|uniref:restriction endonuclease subunit S n=1 Tax=Halovenus sp. HT40 TaxID=3126691 RepID=UPI00300F5811
SATAPRLNGSHQFNSASEFSIGKYRPCLENGKTAFVNVLDDDEVAVGSTEFIVLSATDRTLPKFVYYTARRPEIRQFAIKRMTGTSGRQRVPLDIFDNKKIDIPPLEEQKKIVNILDSLDSKIEVNNQISKLLENVAQSLFKSRFIDFDESKELEDSDLGKIPKEYDVKKLSEIAEIEMGSSPDSKYYNESGDGLPFFQGNKNFSDIYPKIKRWCSNPGKVAEEGDVIMTVRAPVGEINKLQEKSCIGRGVAAFRSKSFDSNEYIYYLLKSRKERWNQFASGTTYESVNSTDVKNFPFVCPTEEDRREFIDTVKPMANIIENKFHENKHLEELRDILLPKLMSGEIRVDDIKLEELEVDSEV